MASKPLACTVTGITGELFDALTVFENYPLDPEALGSYLTPSTGTVPPSQESPLILQPLVEPKPVPL